MRLINLLFLFLLLMFSLNSFAVVKAEEVLNSRTTEDFAAIKWRLKGKEFPAVFEGDGPYITAIEGFAQGALTLDRFTQIMRILVTSFSQGAPLEIDDLDDDATLQAQLEALARNHGGPAVRRINIVIRDILGVQADAEVRDTVADATAAMEERPLARAAEAARAALQEPVSPSAAAASMAVASGKGGPGHGAAQISARQRHGHGGDKKAEVGPDGACHKKKKGKAGLAGRQKLKRLWQKVKGKQELALFGGFASAVVSGAYLFPDAAHRGIKAIGDQTVFWLSFLKNTRRAGE